MKEKILEIIDDEINAHNQIMPSVITRKDIVKRITSMVMEFIEWKDNKIEYNEKENIYRVIERITFGLSIEDYTLKELFQYWFDNIYKNK